MLKLEKLVVPKKEQFKSKRAEQFVLDEIGAWSEIKLEIIQKYARAYTTILSKKGLHFAYIDAFAGAGVNISRATGEFVLGSPLNALLVEPHFHHHYFIDLDSQKTSYLRKIVGDRSDVTIEEGDCNVFLEEKVFPKVKYKDFWRALCILDPYGLHLNWNVIQTAAKMESIEIFLNFPLMDMNRNALWRNPQGVEKSQLERMSAFYGDDSWTRVIYRTNGNLFGWMEKVEDANRVIVRAFRDRLKTVAGFQYVPEPLPMRNSSGATLYYLFFASHQPVAQKIVADIFDKYS
jgi:three-Cys-motif partner protein